MEGIATTIEQVGKTIAHLNPRKALEVDGILIAAIMKAFQRFLEEVTQMVNLYYREYFPSIWKEKRIVLIPKGEERLSSGHRPICILLKGLIIKRS